MPELKHCHKCSRAVEQSEIHREGCAYCSNLMEGEPGYVELTAQEWDELKDYEPTEFDLELGTDLGINWG